jgi:putative endonuclease
LNWKVYIILCSDDTLYTGITTDIERRMFQHADGCGAKYFRGRRPKQLLYLEGGHDRSSASKREMAIKAMKRNEKQLLIRAGATLPAECSSFQEITLATGLSVGAVKKPSLLAVLAKLKPLDEEFPQIEDSPVEVLLDGDKYVNI